MKSDFQHFKSNDQNSFNNFLSFVTFVKLCREFGSSINTIIIMYHLVVDFSAISLVCWIIFYHHNSACQESYLFITVGT